MVARVMKKRRVNKLLLKDTSTVFDFFSTKWNLRERRKEAAMQATGLGHTDILKYFVEERKISDEGKFTLGAAAKFGRLDCLKYLLGEEAKAPLNFWQYVAYARYYEHPDCENYLLEKGAQNQRTKNTLCLSKTQSSFRTGYEKR